MKQKFLIIGIALIYIALSIVSALDGGDFDVFLDAAIKLNNGQNIYVPPFFKGLQYFYSPLFALVLIPFSWSFFVTELTWLLLSGLMLYRSWSLIKSYFDLSVLTKKEISIWTGISFFFIVRFLLYNISMIQITIFLLWAILESITLIKNNKTLKGSGLLAFAINVKLMPLVAVPYLLYRGYFRSVLYVVLFSFVFLFLPALIIGWEFNSFLLKEWWLIINPANSEHLVEASTNSQSIVGTIPVYITEIEGALPYKRNLFNLSIETVEIFANLIRLSLVLLALYFLKSPFKKSVSNISEIRAIGYLLMVIPLIFPHQQKYAFIFLFPMIAYLSYYSMVMWKYNRTRSFKVFLVFLLIISINYTPIIGSDIIGRFNYDLVHHYRLLGISTLLLIVAAVYADPKTIDVTLKNIKTTF
ncbi:MAG: hypothetical protein DRI54_04060 [Bacteroidetes bacterium]|nr:MAG: hypothetical protein DRI54_04060 [Bacteroidota bacterium]